MLAQKLFGASSQPVGISLVGTTEGIGSGNSISVAYPAGTQDGDLAIICISTNNNLFTGYSASGWTSVNYETNPTGIKANLLRRTVSGTGTQVFSKSGFVPSQLSYILVVFRNATYSSFSKATGTSGTPNPDQLEGTFNAVIAFGNSAVGDSSVTPPTGYTTLGEINNTNITTMGGYLIGSSTNPNPLAFSGISSAAWIAYTIGLT